MTEYQHIFDFILPRGLPSQDGQVIREGQMRLATALDEIEAVHDPRVDQNEAYLPVILLSRVITRLGDMAEITPKVIESLFAIDLSYLEDLYLRLNSQEAVIVGAVCPNCSTHFQLQVSPLIGNEASSD
jgi:hypothetical protein